MAPESSNPGNAWMTFALMTVAAWGLYGILLHAGQVAMAAGPETNAEHNRYKAFLWVGIAYVLVAVLAPTLLLMKGEASWSMPGKGIGLSLLAGIAGAVGAFCVLLAFGAKGHPAVVMSIIFAGAPIVNAVVALLLHPPAGGYSTLKPQFLFGILLALAGGAMVTLYKPGPPIKKAASPVTTDGATTPPAGGPDESQEH